MCKGSTADSDSVCLGSNPSSAANGPDSFGAVFFEVWRSLVARFVRDEEVAGSNPVTSTSMSVHNGFRLWTLIFCFGILFEFGFTNYMLAQALD